MSQPSALLRESFVQHLPPLCARKDDSDSCEVAFDDTPLPLSNHDSSFSQTSFGFTNTPPQHYCCQRQHSKPHRHFQRRQRRRHISIQCWRRCLHLHHSRKTQQCCWCQYAKSHVVCSSCVRYELGKNVWGVLWIFVKEISSCTFSDWAAT